MPEELAAAVADEVRRLLADRGITGRDLSRATGISQSSMARKLAGTQPIDLGDLPRICDALGVSVTDVIAWATRRG